MSAGSVASQSATGTRTTPVSAWIALAVLMLPVLLIAIGAGLGAATWAYVNAPSILGSGFNRPRRGVGGRPPPRRGWTRSPPS